MKIELKSLTYLFIINFEQIINLKNSKFKIQMKTHSEYCKITNEVQNLPFIVYSHTTLLLIAFTSIQKLILLPLKRY